MATLTELRDGLAYVIKSNLDVMVYPQIEDVIETPAVVIGLRPGTELRPSIKFDGAFGRGMDEYFFEIHVFVTHREGGYSQKDLDQYISGSGPKSIRKVLYDHSELGLDATDAFVESVINYNGQASVAKIPHVGATLVVCVRTSG